MKSSWQQPLLTGTVTALGAVHVLETVRIVRPAARLYQASSSEMYGLIQEEDAERKNDPPLPGA